VGLEEKQLKETRSDDKTKSGIRWELIALIWGRKMSDGPNASIDKSCRKFLSIGNFRMRDTIAADRSTRLVNRMALVLIEQAEREKISLELLSFVKSPALAADRFCDSARVRLGSFACICEASRERRR
jgi:hypothetical protein